MNRQLRIPVDVGINYKLDPMNAKLFIILILILSSCSGQPQKVKGKESTQQNVETIANDIHQNDPTEVLKNGLLPALKGDWISSILPDSIRLNRKILPYKNVFYGNLMISINDKDTILIYGNMDRGPVKIVTTSNKSFVIPEWNNSQVSYSEDRDVIFMGSGPSAEVYRRLIDEQILNIIRDEKSLMDYVINLVFTDEYMSKDEIAQIKYISLGLETYTPFTFDAIGIANEKMKSNISDGDLKMTHLTYTRPHLYMMMIPVSYLINWGNLIGSISKNN